MDYLWVQIIKAWREDDLAGAMAFEHVLTECEGLTEAEFAVRFPRAHMFVNEQLEEGLRN